MIQHIKTINTFFLYLIFFIFFSCEKISSQKSENKNNAVVSEKKQVQNNWKVLKIFSLAPESNYDCNNEKYNNFLFALNNDSVFINNNYVDDVYIIKLSPKSYFEKKYLLDVYQKRLKEELNLDLPPQIKTIRNKKAYDKSSQLDRYFRDAFFIDEYMFFEDNGCIICLTKKGTDGKITNDTAKHKDYFTFSNLKLPYQKKIDINNINYSEMATKDIDGLSAFACGEEKIRYIPLSEKGNIDLILIPMDCGDTKYRFYLLSIVNKKVISNLYVEGELFEPEANTKPEKTTFSIDKESILTVKTINKNFQNKIDNKIYIINNLGQIIEN